MKNILKEFQSKTDITIETDDSLITYIKEFFKSNNTEPTNSMFSIVKLIHSMFFQSYNKVTLFHKTYKQKN